MSSCQCSCQGAPTLIFACSGAADVGGLADAAARALTRQGTGRMYCLAGVGGRVSGIVATTQAADKILVIDGCPLECARKTLEEAGFSSMVHVQLQDLGFRKGESPVTEANVAAVMDAAVARMGC
ncbi:MAG: hypothetical protein JG774_1473 [Desulfomicrobiaceae bacterium]|nr:putative zinc-binding protein [Desulfomicrobiaceae bacterium]MBZ4685728.1 hypothetical protein [Desulfomicrobiaceae bacterium]MDI3492400.1 hypothetical protein [Desulfomicrobiaceae bacterium]MDK2873233.1 hypothetical protein [Desulfomicrobiaceae bacterium]HCF04967.1 zinc-binding protein [Desulfomicrobiaceae bacterium]